MADKKEKRPRLTTPRGEFIFPKLFKPDYGTTEFPCPKGRYSVTMAFDPKAPGVPAFLAKLNVLHEEAIAAGEEAFAALPLAKRKKLGELKKFQTVEEEFNADDQPTGRVLVKFKRDASGTDPKTQQNWTAVVPCFDVHGLPIDLNNPPKAWTGTLGKVTFSTAPWFKEVTGCGLLRQLVAAQIIKISQASASSYGFADEGEDYPEDAPGGEEPPPHETAPDF